MHLMLSTVLCHHGPSKHQLAAQSAIGHTITGEPHVQPNIACGKLTIKSSKPPTLHPLHALHLTLLCLQAFTKVATLAPSAYQSLNNSANTFPANVSGTYKGTWHLSDPDAGASALPVLKQGQGTIAFQLEATPSGTEEVLNVQVCVVLLH